MYDWLHEIKMDQYRINFLKEEIYMDCVVDLDSKAMDKVFFILQNFYIHILAWNY